MIKIIHLINNVLYLSITNFKDMYYANSDCIGHSTKHVYSWERASRDDIIVLYKVVLDSKLESCIYDYDVVHCNDIHCNNYVHRA